MDTEEAEGKCKPNLIFHNLFGKYDVQRLV